MFHGKEKKTNKKDRSSEDKKSKNKKDKLHNIRQKEDECDIDSFTKSNFNRPNSSNEISVIYPVKNDDKNK